MSAAAEDQKPGVDRARIVFYLYATSALLLCLLVAFLYVRRDAVQSLLALPFYVGETSWDLIKGKGLSFRFYPIPNQMIWMYSARMPVATLYATAAMLYLGPSQVLLATALKAILLFLPVLGAARLVLYRSAGSTRRLLFTASVLALPLLVPAFFADVVNLQAEEGFVYAFLTIAFALVAVGPPQPSMRWSLLWYTLAAAMALDMLYLSKSSMILVVAVLLAFSLLRNGTAWSRVLLLLLVVAAPVGWAMRQHAVSGRYAIGTSYDGANLHKGNSGRFLAHYPPGEGDNLDFYEGEIAPAHPLGDEWAYSDWHRQQAIGFIRTHPRETLIGWQKKAYVFLVALHVYGNGGVAAPKPLLWIGMFIFRLLLWVAIGLSVAVAVRGRGRRRVIALLYLAVVAAGTLPYIIGFGYTRHASVLIYPSAIAICLLASGLRTVPGDGPQGGFLPGASPGASPANG